MELKPLGPWDLYGFLIGYLRMRMLDRCLA